MSSDIGLKIHNVSNDKLAEIFEVHGDDDALDSFFLSVDGLLNLGYMLFSGVGVENYIFHQFVYGLVKLHVHDYILYYNVTSEIYFHEPFKYLLNCLSIMAGTCSTVTNFILC